MLEVPPEEKPEMYDRYALGDITVFVFSPLEFRGNLLRIDLQNRLLAKPCLVAGVLKLL